MGFLWVPSGFPMGFLKGCPVPEVFRLESSHAWSSYLAQRAAARCAADGDFRGAAFAAVEYLGDQLDPRHAAKKEKNREKKHMMSMDFLDFL